MELLITLLISLSAGSFANNIVSSSLNREIPDLYRSRCFCGIKVLGIKELIPIFSFFILKGRCSFCKEKIPLRFLVLEVITMLTGLSCYFMDGFSLYALYEFMILYLLLLTAVIDYYEFIIPNFLILSFIVIAIIRSYLISTPSGLDLIIMIVMPLTLLAINKYFEVYRNKQALGYGDVKLISILSLIFPFPLSILGLWISAIIAVPGTYTLRIFSNRLMENGKIPFGFFISICFALFIYAGDKLEFIYLKLMGLY